MRTPGVPRTLRALRGPARRLAGPGAGPLVSVVVLPETSPSAATTDCAAWPACLAAVFDAGHRAVEVLLPAEAGRRWTRRARRLPAGAGPDDAVAAARGEFLVFVLAGDRLAPGGLAPFVAALGRSGSDAAISAEGPERSRVDPAQVAVAFADLSPGGKVFRLASWRRRATPMPSWDGAADAVAAVLLGGTLDLLPAVLHRPRQMDPALPVADQRDFRADLAAERRWSLLAAAGRIRGAGQAAYETWLAAVSDRLLPAWAAAAVGGGERYLDELAPLARALLCDLPPAAAQRVGAAARVSAWTAAHGTWHQVAAWQSHLLDHPFGLPHRDGMVDLPAELRPAPPDALRALTTADRRPRLWLGELARDGDGLRLHGRCFTEYAGPGGLPTVRLDGREATVTRRPDPEANAWAARAFEDRSGAGFEARWPAVRLPGTGQYDVEVCFDGHRLTERVPVRPPPAKPPGAVVVAAAELRGDLLRLSGPAVTRPSPGVLEVPLAATVFGTRVCLRSGRHEVRLLADGSAAPPVRLPNGWAEQPPTLVGPRLSVRPEAPGGRLAVVVGPPLSPEDRSAFRQATWRASVYAAVARPSYDQTVLLESFRGRAVSDNPLAVARELLARDAGFELVFVVDDPSVAVPDGLRSLPRRTREWYDLLANARFHVTNAGSAGFFARKPGQVHVQTWHGTPLKRLGEDRGPGDLATWRHRRTIARQAAGWDALVSPSPYCTEIFRRAFPYRGVVLEAGQPRNDVLVGPSADLVRERTRRTLGLDDADLAVLYAPTWRQYAGVQDAKPLYLDADLLTRKVPRSVVLVRGHYNATGRRDVYAGHARVRDVTRYPDIAELYLAADVLVTDYSSVMFDFALTDRPIVLLAPDLARYRDVERGFYLDIEAEAPGPLLSTTGQVVAALRDRAAAVSEFAGARERFRTRFCPFDDGRSSARVVDSCIMATPSGMTHDEARRDPA